MKKIFAAIFILFLLTVLAGCMPALHDRAYKGDTKALKEMLDGGGDVNDSFVGVPLLITAAQGGNIDAVRLLLDRGANMNAKYDGTSALFWAAWSGHADVAKLLIERGSDITYDMALLESRGKTYEASYADKCKSGLKLLERLAKKEQPSKQTESLAAKPSQESYPIVKSDIDELPAIKMKCNKNAYAIVIGIENYRQKLPKADYATQDARLVSEYLIKAMGYPEENVRTLINEHATYTDLTKYFEKWLGNNVEKDSTVFIYFSGHGAPNTKTGDAYLVPYDGDPTFITETGYSIARLYESLGKLKAKEITVVLDSCFSGAGGRSVLAKGAKPLVMTINMPTIQKNISVMTASAGDQISSAYEEKGHGLFTYFMLKGIKDEDVVRQDGSIKMDDLFGYIKPQVERIARKQFNNEQTPQLIGAKK
jgi:hypothetical protein